jgi:hypothetical protein
MIAFFDLRSDFRFIECIAALGKLFFAVSGLSDRHGIDLATTGWLYFSLDDRSIHKDDRSGLAFGLIGVGRSIVYSIRSFIWAVGVMCAACVMCATVPIGFN